MSQLKGAGMFGIEMFLTKLCDVLINEIAPRVHNSGALYIEANETSQFEQHARQSPACLLDHQNENTGRPL